MLFAIQSLNRFRAHFLVVEPTCFICSTSMLSMPGALLLFSDIIAVWSSLSVSTVINVSPSVLLSCGFFLVGYVEERLWWPIQSPNIGRKKKASS